MKHLLNFSAIILACMSLTSCIFSESTSDVIYQIQLSINSQNKSISTEAGANACAQIESYMTTLAGKVARQWMDTVNFEDYSGPDKTAALTWESIQGDITLYKDACNQVISNLPSDNKDMIYYSYSITMTRLSGYDGSTETLEATTLEFSFNK